MWHCLTDSILMKEGTVFFLYGHSGWAALLPAALPELKTGMWMIKCRRRHFLCFIGVIRSLLIRKHFWVGSGRNYEWLRLRLQHAICITKMLERWARGINHNYICLNAFYGVGFSFMLKLDGFEYREVKWRNSCLLCIILWFRWDVKVYGFIDRFYDLENYDAGLLTEGQK